MVYLFKTLLIAASTLQISTIGLALMSFMLKRLETIVRHVLLFL